MRKDRWYHRRATISPPIGRCSRQAPTIGRVSRRGRPRRAEARHQRMLHPPVGSGDHVLRWPDLDRARGQRKAVCVSLGEGSERCLGFGSPNRMGPTTLIASIWNSRRTRSLARRPRPRSISDLRAGSGRPALVPGRLPPIPPGPRPNDRGPYRTADGRDRQGPVHQGFPLQRRRARPLGQAARQARRHPCRGRHLGRRGDGHPLGADPRPQDRHSRWPSAPRRSSVPTLKPPSSPRCPRPSRGRSASSW